MKQENNFMLCPFCKEEHELEATKRTLNISNDGKEWITFITVNCICGYVAHSTTVKYNFDKD